MRGKDVIHYWEQICVQVTSSWTLKVSKIDMNKPSLRGGHSRLFDNPFVMRNRVVKPTDFPELGSLGSSLSFFYYPGTNIIMNWQDFMTRHSMQIAEEKYIDIRYTISTALAKLRLNSSSTISAQFPEKPLLIDIALSSRKGASTYYKLLTHKTNINNKLHLRETKCKIELNFHLSINFWHKARVLCATIHENNLRWLQFQIVRNSLQTDSIVHHFIAHISPSCSYCEIEENVETISHLFWGCTKIAVFINEIRLFFGRIGLIFQPSRIQFLFGYLELSFCIPKNYLTLAIKKYIWITKFKNKDLSLVGFRSFFKMHVTDLMIVLDMKGLPEMIAEWDYYVEFL